MKKENFKPSNCGLASSTDNMMRQAGKLLDQIGWFNSGTLENCEVMELVRKFRWNLIELMEKDGCYLVDKNGWKFLHTDYQKRKHIKSLREDEEEHGNDYQFIIDKVVDTMEKPTKGDLKRKEVIA